MMYTVMCCGQCDLHTGPHDRGRLVEFGNLPLRICPSLSKTIGFSRVSGVTNQADTSMVLRENVISIRRTYKYNDISYIYIYLRQYDMSCISIYIYIVFLFICTHYKS